MGAAATVVAAVAVVGCILFCPRGGPEMDTTPPSINCPNVQDTIYTDRGLRTARVRYDDATARDNDGIRSISQTYPPDLRSGDRFPVGNHRVAFMARDRTGNTATCDFRFSVEARTCSFPSRPGHGDVSCETPANMSPVYGESCSFSCDTGYDLIGSTTHECRANGNWDGGGSVTCQIRTCPEPSVPENAVLDSCTESYNYDSVCVFTCLDGYSLPSGSERSLRCGADENWIGTPQGCIDSESPVIENCPESQTVYVGPNADYALATWDIPTATDNHDSTVAVTLESGLTPGSQFPLSPSNVHGVVYGAEDAAGNVAEQCAFYVIVQQLTCPPIPHRYRLNITCPVTLVYGSMCTFECDQGYPLQGPTEAHCDRTFDDPPTAYWNWGENGAEPFCERYDCPPLDTPLNGALACDTWVHGISCQILCHEEWDIPRTAPDTGRYTCSDTTGDWIPYETVPDCSRARRGNSMNLPGELFYFSGDCTAPETQEQIRQNFIDQLNESEYSALCTLYPDCTVQNVNVTCGEVSERKKRSLALQSHRFERQTQTYTHTVNVTFAVVLPDIYIPDATVTEIDDATYDQFAALEDFFMTYVESGGMDIPGLQLQEGSLVFGLSELECQLGTVAEYSTFTCRPCPTGTYHDIASGNCTYCPIGTYQDQDGAFNCIPCPEGNSTEESGARSADKCIRICVAGQYSDNGLVPCSPCPLNTYTEEDMQEECTACPTGSYTSNIGADSLLDCVSNIIPGGPCSTNPCNSVGVCVSRDGAYECHCSGGYSGTNCEIAPDPCDVHVCQNGATCVPVGEGEDDYNCQCRNMYAGDLCQYQKVHGHWGEWSEWTSCSSSCGDGQQTRARRCNSPSPNAYGDDCDGESAATVPCYEGDCPACVDLVRPYGAVLECMEFEDDRECTINCRPGLVKAQTYPTTLTCGPDTNYTWSPDVDPNNLPSCSQARFPPTLGSRFNVEYTAPPLSEDARQSYRETVLDMASETAHCITDGTCSASVEIVSDESDVSKRSATQTIVIVIEVDLDDYDFMEGGVYNNDTAMEGLENIISFVSQLESFAVQFNQSIHNGSLVLTIDGEDYLPNADSIGLVGDVQCSDGEAILQFICVSCPPGSYGDGSDCTLCSVGEYQAEEGQTSCITCPDGLTTNNVGSVNSSDCIEITINCPAGSHGDGTECTFCSLGEYQPLDGQTGCLSCPDGLTTLNVGSINITDCIEPLGGSEEEEDESEEDDNNNKSGNSDKQRGLSDGELALVVSLPLAILVITVLVLLYIHKQKKVQPAAPSTELYEVPPPYQEVDTRKENPALRDHNEAVRYTSLPPISTTLPPKNKAK